ncbi:uncharacterized protein KD926_002397 [Aspergillus affinis]|uniref:uncharacterized protein n=1 Tax=Aspergillus affinis TaxID=1070780 RepID=UPI0022FDE396|nr:uncharacterized protein KD926_002397 [Aspergillus affinis]KAI9044017.1 hypothetical protein KD926_002397 [Aspergillus affinis]
MVSGVPTLALEEALDRDLAVRDLQDKDITAQEEKHAPIETPQHVTSGTQTPASMENRLRPAADIINRIIWDSNYDSANYIIGYEDRFEGRLEVGISSQTIQPKPYSSRFYSANHSTRAVHQQLRNMAQRLRKLDFSRMKKHNHSSTSSASSPIVPVLETPAAFSVQSVSPGPAGKQKAYFGRPHVRPSVFVENIEDDEVNASAAQGHSLESKKGLANADCEEESISREKTRYFEEIFSIRNPLTSTKSRTNQEDIIVVEIKLRTRVKNDEEFARLVASRMASIYQKSESQFMINIQQDSYLYMGTPRFPAYLIKIFALPQLIGPVTNLRCTILIQGLLQEVALIGPNRGVVLFYPILEENFATNGATMMGEIPRLDRHSSEEQDQGIFRSITRSLSRLKSSSTHSAPASEATTSSWTGVIEHQREKSTLRDDTSEEETSRSVRKSRSRRQRFLPGRGSSDPSHPVDQMCSAADLLWSKYEGWVSLQYLQTQSKKSESFKFIDAMEQSCSTAVGSKIEEREGNLFDAPDGAALIHACNCQGCWSAGIARMFKTKYPAAYAVYKAHCENLMRSPKTTTAPNASDGMIPDKRILLSPEGTALIIPPQKRDYEGPRGSKKHWIICLFTSRKFGRKASPPPVILSNTELAVVDMKRQLEELRADESVEVPISRLWSCRFNSGLFRVDWSLSRKVLQDAGLDVIVVRPEGEE